MSNLEDPLMLAQACAEKMYAADLASRELGIVVNVPEPGKALAAMTVNEKMVNGHGVCHGGYVFTLADTAFAFACNAYNRVTVAASATIEFLAPVRDGDRLVASATERHRGRRSGTYDVSVSNQAGDLVALFRGRSASRNEPMLDEPT